MKSNKETKIYPSTKWYENAAVLAIVCVFAYIIASTIYIITGTITDILWNSMYNSFKMILGVVAVSASVVLGAMVYTIVGMVRHFRNNGVMLRYDGRNWLDLHILKRVELVVSIVLAPAFCMMIILESAKYSGILTTRNEANFILAALAIIAVIKLIGLRKLSLWKK